jgi:hypothetical protein
MKTCPIKTSDSGRSLAEAVLNPLTLRRSKKSNQAKLIRVEKTGARGFLEA